MQKLNIYEAKSQFSKIIEQAHQGSSFVIAKSGKPLAQIIPLEVKKQNNFHFGTMLNEIKIADDFDAPLPEKLQNKFESNL